MITVDQAQQLLGARIVATDGDNVGTVNEVYLDDFTGQPSWVTVATGWFGLSESFVPLDRARISGDQIQVPFDKATIKGAPRYDGGEPLSPHDEDELYRYYALTSASSAAARDAGTNADSGNGSAGNADTTGGGSYPDESLIRWEEQFSVRPPLNPEKSVTRSEDQLTVGTERVPAGRARLRKYVVSEQQTVTVPVSHEEVRLEREPIAGTDRDKESTGAAFTEQDVEIVLHAERPVVTVESIPVERIRVDNDTVTREEPVTGDVRKEHVELGDDESPLDREDQRTPKSVLFGGHR